MRLVKGCLLLSLRGVGRSCESDLVCLSTKRRCFDALHRSLSIVDLSYILPHSGCDEARKKDEDSTKISYFYVINTLTA
jgi:hypothetical protein